jgi:hypothetical protein
MDFESCTFEERRVREFVRDIGWSILLKLQGLARSRQKGQKPKVVADLEIQEFSSLDNEISSTQDDA